MNWTEYEHPPGNRSEANALFRRVCGDGIMPMLFDSDRLAKCDEFDGSPW